MAFQAVPDTAEITIVITQNLEIITNTIAAEKPGGYSQLDISTLAILVDGLIATHLLPLMTLDATYLRTEVRGLAVINDLFAQDATSTGPGGVATEGLPNNVTLSIKRSSGFTGRSARGRVYFIGFPVNDLAANENQFTQSQVDSAVAGWEGVRVGILAGPWTPVIVSRFLDKVQRTVGVTFDWITTTAVNRNVDSQRGRLSG